MKPGWFQCSTCGRISRLKSARISAWVDGCSGASAGSLSSKAPGSTAGITRCRSGRERYSATQSTRACPARRNSSGSMSPPIEPSTVASLDSRSLRTAISMQPYTPGRSGRLAVTLARTPLGESRRATGRVRGAPRPSEPSSPPARRDAIPASPRVPAAPPRCRPAWRRPRQERVADS